jgi:ankyrin repeat protein
VIEALARAPGSDINSRDGAGSTPLHYAAAAGHSLVVDVLWPLGAELDAPDAAGRTPLHLAAAAASGGDGGAGGLEVLRRLVIAGCSVATTDNAGFAAGHIAAFNGKAVLRVLALH